MMMEVSRVGKMIMILMIRVRVCVWGSVRDWYLFCEYFNNMLCDVKENVNWFCCVVLLGVSCVNSVK